MSTDTDPNPIPHRCTCPPGTVHPQCRLHGRHDAGLHLIAGSDRLAGCICHAGEALPGCPWHRWHVVIGTVPRPLVTGNGLVAEPLPGGGYRVRPMTPGDSEYWGEEPGLQRQPRRERPVAMGRRVWWHVNGRPTYIVVPEQKSPAAPLIQPSNVLHLPVEPEVAS